MRKVPIVISAATVLLFFNACEDGGTAPPPPPPLDLSEPAKTLEAVEQAFNDRDSDDLALCLADAFTFYFDEGDVGDEPGDYIIPETWGKEEFLEAVGNMFAEVYSIDMDIDTSNVGTPGEDDTTYSAENVEVSLLVMIDPVNGCLAHGLCNFRFAKVTSGGYDNWRIEDWWDYTHVYSESDNRASIGWILAYFYAG
jgi:hypothetical protein